MSLDDIRARVALNMHPFSHNAALQQLVHEDVPRLLAVGEAAKDFLRIADEPLEVSGYRDLVGGEAKLRAALAALDAADSRGGK